MGSSNAEAWKTNARRRQQAREADAKYRQYLAWQHAAEDRAACEQILWTGLNGKPVDPEIRAAALETVNRRYSLRPRGW